MNFFPQTLLCKISEMVTPKNGQRVSVLLEVEVEIFT